jgi:2-polyprenyl-3-methyl-5-hydroxy-6-metoxy-1,4-benzoquinol methylase
VKKSRTTADARGWEELARLDPLWAVASSPQLRHGRWDEEEFYEGGRRKVRKLMKRLDALGVPARSARALDFGCGAGRLTLPLADHFDAVVGLDIAPSMLALARMRAAGRPGLEFSLDETGDQSLLAGESFDLVYSGLVLQHLASVAAALACLERLCAAVGPGGALVVQVPIWLRANRPLRVRQRLYTALRRVGVPARVLYRRAGLHPMTMMCVPRERVEACVRGAGLAIVRIDERTDDDIVSLTIYAARTSREPRGQGVNRAAIAQP